MSLKDQMLRTARTAILDTGEFAENISYTPYGGSAKTIKAIVDRQDMQAESVDGGNTLARYIRISVANHADDGILSVSVRKDKVSVPWREGGTAEDWLVHQVESKDSGMWTLLCGK